MPHSQFPRQFSPDLNLKNIPTVKQIARIIESIAPKAIALPGDPVGLQCGEPDQPVNRLMLALDATLGTVTQATELKANLLVTHHPLLFEPLTQENIHEPAGRAIARAIRGDLAVYSAHTNLDASQDGINASFANLLDLRDRRFLDAGGPDSFKVVVFVPGKDLENVRSAAIEAGAGKVGDYSGCSFGVEGVGTFRPEEGATPAIGQTGRSEKVPEVRFEMTVQSETLAAVLNGVKRVHPYEEPAIDIYPTMTGIPVVGLGIVGSLPRRLTVGQVSARIDSALNAGSVRLVGKKGTRIKSVAVCAGSGASLLNAAVAARADLFITGDMKYHDARKAEEAGIQVLDVGHFAPEKYGFNRFGKLLESKFAKQGFKVEIVLAKERDPFIPLS